MSYLYDAELVRVIDGDTVRFKVSKTFDVGFYVTQTSTYVGNFRLIGINTPEIRGKEKRAGLISKDIVQRLLSSSPYIKIETFKPDKYGRWLAKVFIVNEGKEVILNDYLVNNGYAKSYMVD